MAKTTPTPSFCSSLTQALASYSCAALPIKKGQGALLALSMPSPSSLQIEQGQKRLSIDLDPRLMSWKQIDSKASEKPSPNDLPPWPPIQGEWEKLFSSQELAPYQLTKLSYDRKSLQEAQSARRGSSLVDLDPSRLKSIQEWLPSSEASKALTTLPPQNLVSKRGVETIALEFASKKEDRESLRASFTLYLQVATIGPLLFATQIAYAKSQSDHVSKDYKLLFVSHDPLLIAAPRKESRASRQLQQREELSSSSSPSEIKSNEEEMPSAFCSWPSSLSLRARHELVCYAITEHAAQERRTEQRRLEKALEQLEKEDAAQTLSEARYLTSSFGRNAIERLLTTAHQGSTPKALPKEQQEYYELKVLAEEKELFGLLHEMIMLPKSALHGQGERGGTSEWRLHFNAYLDKLFGKVKRQQGRIEQLQSSWKLLEEEIKELIEEGRRASSFPSFPSFFKRQQAKKAGRAVVEEESKEMSEHRRPKKPYRTFLSSAGIEILVGRSARDNMLVSFKVARPRDLWLHVHPYPGSHVVIRAEKEQCDGVTLQEAMLLAKHFSGKARPLKEALISITEARYLRVIPGAPAGKVRLLESSHKKIYDDPRRLESLLGQELHL